MWKPSTAALIASGLLVACAAATPTLRDPRTGLLAPCMAACVSSQSPDEATRVPPIRYVSTVVEARAKMGRVLKRMQVYTVLVNEGDYIYATTGEGRSIDDIEMVFSQTEPGTIHIRSAARGGFGGAERNRQHAEDIRRAFNVAKS